MISGKEVIFQPGLQGLRPKPRTGLVSHPEVHAHGAYFHSRGITLRNNSVISMSGRMEMWPPMEEDQAYGHLYTHGNMTVRA